MDEKRMQEIALSLIRYRLRTEGFRFHPQMKRELGNAAKATGISVAELQEFGKKILDEFTVEIFSK